MFDFLEWYFPWVYLDTPLKIMGIAWLLSTALGVLIFVRSVIFKKRWLSMRHLQLSDEQTDQESP